MEGYTVSDIIKIEETGRDKRTTKIKYTANSMLSIELRKMWNL